jgi:hypothetical protein
VRLVRKKTTGRGRYHFAILGLTNYTKEFTKEDSKLVPASARYTDRFRYAEVQAAYGSRDWESFFELCDCSSERLWPALGWWGSGTEALLRWSVSHGNSGVDVARLRTRLWQLWCRLCSPANLWQLWCRRCSSANLWQLECRRCSPANLWQL